MKSYYRIGDEVKMLHERSEARIIQVYPNGRLLVLIDDLLEIEVSEKDVVHKVPPPPPETPHQAGVRRLEKGQAALPVNLLLGVDAGMDKPVQVFLINNTAQEIVFTVFVMTGTLAKGKLWGHLDLASAQMLFSTRSDNWDESSQLVFQFLPFHTHAAPLAEPVQMEFKLKSKHLLKEKTYVPYLDRDLVILPLQAPAPVETGNIPTEAPKTSRKADFSAFDRMKEDLLAAERPEQVVDLHLDKLLKDPFSADAATALAIQLEAFEKCLSLAVAHALPEIIFIHGIGTGRLKAELHKRLRDYTFVRGFFLDHAKRFGSGATVVQL